MAAASGSSRLYFMRRVKNAAAMSLATAATIFGLIWLIWILWTTFVNGVSAFGPKLFTQMTPPPGEDGGLLNAFYGSLAMTVLAILIGTPVGIAAGAYLSEFARRSRVGMVIRFVNDILLSAPSIVVGLFIYEVVVRAMGHFSAIAGGLALAFILLPVVVKTTDEMLQLVPGTVREAALSLGLPFWKVISQVVFRASRAGIVTGVLLGVARISGETAPLLFTALNNQYWTTTLTEPMANVPVVIFQYAMSPYDSWHSLAWAGAFVVTVFVLVLSILARVLVSGKATRYE